MDMVGGDHIGENRNIELSGRLVEISPIQVPVFFKTEKIAPLVTAVGDPLCP